MHNRICHHSPKYSYLSVNPNLTSIPWHWVKLQRQSFGWSRKEELYWFARQRVPQWANALKAVCPDLECIVRSFIVMVQRGRCDQLVDFLLIGWWWGKCESALSTFWFQLIWSLRACGQLPSLTWWEFQYLQNSSQILLCVSLEWEPGLVPRLHYWFLTASPLSLHRFPSLISNCLNLPVGTQGKAWRLNEA